MHKLKELKYEVLPHPPYSPDLSPIDYHLFKHFEHFIKEKNFKEQLTVENSFKNFLVSRDKGINEGINKLLVRWQKCIDVNGDYFDNYLTYYLNYLKKF